ncbi:hypothetical protein PMAYCL1PPCAC_13817, partial [Pristionchus mayeri]
IKHEDSNADMYCPSAGISRSLDQSTPRIDSDPPSKTRVERRTCVVCHLTRTKAEMREFTSIPEKRMIWVEAVRSTPEGRRILMEFLNAKKRSFLCASHFSSSDCFKMANVVRLRPDAIPSDQILRHKYVVCQVTRNMNEMVIFPNDNYIRSRWANAIYPTLEERRLLLEVLNVRKRSYLCLSHFSPSDYNITANSSKPRLRFN